MKSSKSRTVFAVLILVVCGAVLYFKFAPGGWVDGSLEGQTRKLHSYWAFQRREAAANLARFAGEDGRVVPELLKALHDPDGGVQANAMRSLKAMSKLSDDAAPELVSVLEHDQDSAIRQEAASLLGMTKVPSAAAALVEAIDDGDIGVCLAALSALSLHGPSAGSAPAVDALIAEIGSTRPDAVRVGAVQALGSIGVGQERVARYLTEVMATDSSPAVRNNAALLSRNPKFGFEIPAMIAALEDESVEVRLTAVAGLCWIGMADDRTVPAVCKAARKADVATREGIGINVEMLTLFGANDKTADEQFTRRYQAAVREFRTVLETRGAGARENVINLLGRLMASYQKSGRPALLEPARAAVAAVLARVEDENEAVSLRLHALNQWTLIEQGQFPASSPASSRSGASVQKEALHARSSWIAAMCKALTSPTREIRSRASEILMDSFRDPGTDLSFREAWRRAVPALAQATRSEDPKVRTGALTMLRLLGPEATEALPTLRSQVHEASGAVGKLAALAAIESITCVDDLNSKDPAARIAAAGALGRLGWRATSALPALIAKLKDPDVKVRTAAASALRALGQVSGTAVPALAAAQTTEADAIVRVAILEALEVIAPGTPPVLDAHLNALRDADPTVRKAGATFQNVPEDDSLVAALATALGDPDDAVRKQVAGSLTQVLFSSSAAIPALCKVLRDPSTRPAVIEALGHHLESTSDSADFRRVQGHLAGLKSALETAIPAIAQVLSDDSEEIGPVVYGLLGRIVAFSDLSKDGGLKNAIEPALQVYLRGVNSNFEAVRAKVLGDLGFVTNLRTKIVSLLQKSLEKPDLTSGDREHMTAALKLLSEPARSKAKKSTTPEF